MKMATNVEMPEGWYWVRFDNGGGNLTDPQPALWNGDRWRSVGWSGQSLHDVLHLERCTPPDADPLQGAADWLCKACNEPDVALLQRQLLIGYNRAARLFASAMSNTTERARA
jgi:DNA segregation ATPase FtsK/SpoIIIE-like protein